MPNLLPPVNWLRVFEVTSRHLSISGAARELSVTPSAVSQQIRLLEHRLKRQLFLRHARGLSLTVAGEALVPVCRESFDRLDLTIQELFGAATADRLVVRVALGFARSWLTRSIAAFCKAHPQIPIRLLASVWASEPLDSNVHLDIRSSSAPARGMDSHQLTHDAVFPVCCRPSARKGKAPSAIQDLRNFPLLHTVGFQQGWTQWLQAAGLKRKAIAADMEFDSMQLSLDMALAGHGVALARTSYCIDLLKSGRLVKPFDLEIKAKDNIYLVHPVGLGAGSAAGMLKNWLIGRVEPQ